MGNEVCRYERIILYEVRIKKKIFSPCGTCQSGRKATISSHILDAKIQKVGRLRRAHLLLFNHFSSPFAERG
jgi:hypothetical protein